MQGVKSFLVEIDPDFYKNIQYKSLELYSPFRGGSLGDLLPKHGKVVGNLPNQDKVKDGDTVFFIHFRLYEREKRDGKTLVDVLPEDVVGVCDEFPEKWNREEINKITPRPVSFAVGEKFSRKEEYEKYFKDRGLIPPNNLPEHEEHIFTATHNIERLDIEKGDRIWVYHNSDYPIDYVENYAFLEYSYITFNETKQRSVGDYVLIAIEKAEKESKLILDRKVIAAKGVGRVISVPKNFDKNISRGDLVRFHISNGQESPVNPMIFTVPYRNIICKYDEGDNKGELGQAIEGRIDSSLS